MNQEDILAVLPESRDEAKSLKEIARDWKTEPMGGKGRLTLSRWYESSGCPAGP